MQSVPALEAFLCFYESCHGLSSRQGASPFACGRYVVPPVESAPAPPVFTARTQHHQRPLRLSQQCAHCSAEQPGCQPSVLECFMQCMNGLHAVLAGHRSPDHVRRGSAVGEACVAAPGRHRPAPCAGFSSNFRSFQPPAHVQPAQAAVFFKNMAGFLGCWTLRARHCAALVEHAHPRRAP